MSNKTNSRINRREFLKLTGFAIALAPLFIQQRESVAEITPDENVTADLTVQETETAGRQGGS